MRSRQRRWAARRSIKSASTSWWRRDWAAGIGTSAPIRLHTLARVAPGRRRSGAAEQADEQVEDRPAYKRMLKTGALDRCGVTLLAGKAVGAPFVGAVAATLALAKSSVFCMAALCTS